MTRQIEDELEAAIDRYAKESDLTVGEAIGALELVKARLIDGLLTKEEKED